MEKATFVGDKFILKSFLIMKDQKKRGNILVRLQPYMGRKRPLIWLSSVAAVVGSFLGLLPYIILWRIVLLLFVPTSGMIDRALVTELAWWAFASAAGHVVLNTVAMLLAHVVAFRVERNLREFSMERAMGMPMAFFMKESTGKLRKVIDENASLIHSFVAHQWPDLISALTTFTALIAMILFVDWRMGLVSLLPIIFSLASMGSLMSSKNYKLGMGEFMQHLELMNNEAVEYVRGIPVVKTFQQSVYSFGRFLKTITDYHKWVTNYAMIAQRPMSIYTVASNSFAFLLIPLALLLMWRGEPVEVVLPSLIFYLLVTPFITRSIMKLVYMVNGFRMSDHALEKVESLFAKENLLPTEQVSGTNPLKITTPETNLSEVSFRYGDADSPLVLKDISLHVPSHKKYALVGASGSGKTTLARLIARFWDPVSGEVSISKTPLRECDPDSILEEVSIVFQQEKLFKLSIRDNVAYGVPNASDAEVAEALRLAQCDDIIEKLPNGWHTMIGSKGIYLSGGEQQRIALARAFLRQTPLLLLDEATAFADPENERAIRQVLDKLMAQKTVVMIAHRLSSVVDADQILVLNEGEIVGQGTHDELLANPESRYSEMWKEYNKSIEWQL